MNNQQTSIDFDVPRLKRGRVSPVSVESISLMKSSETQALMRITIRRRLEVPLESFTFKYRFSALPLSEPDSRHAFHSYLYTDSDMNKSELLTFNGAVPSKMKLEGCSAYVSECRLTDGRVMSFAPTEFTLDADEYGADPTAQPQLPSEQAKAPDSGNRQSAKRRGMNRSRLAVILTILFFILIAEAVVGVYLFRYSDVRKATNELISQNRYNEAYKLASDREYQGLLQTVCEKAAYYYADEGDFEEAYVYSLGAPEPFSDVIIELAASGVVDIATGGINENAYRVAKMAADENQFSSIVRSMTEMLKQKEDYANALRVASELRGQGEREKLEDSIFSDAVTHFLSEHKFDKLAAFIADLDNVQSFSVSAEEAAQAIIAYCEKSGDSSSLIYYSVKNPGLIGNAAVNATIKPDDKGVRAALDVIWPMLSTEQKRTYHTQPIALYKELFVVKNGKISGTDITDAVSVDTYEYHTIVLHKDGSVSAIPNENHNMAEEFPAINDAIQIAAGLSHSVILHADGTVTAIGDNSSGQCNVSGWSDIVAVAAGQSFTLGLKLDGTVVACGSNSCGQCDVSGYRNVVAIAAGSQTSVLLFSDGTVRLQGYCALGLKDAEKLENVVSIRAGSVAVICELKDGSFKLFDGLGSGYFGTTENWRNIVAYDVGSVCVAALDSSGAVYITGDSRP